MKFQKRKREISAFLMLVWLFAWIGMALSHDVLHLVHFEEKSNVACAVCRALDQPAPADISTLAALPLPSYSVVAQLQPEFRPVLSRDGVTPFAPRGPPALLF